MKLSVRILALFSLLWGLVAAGPLRAQTGTPYTYTIMSGGRTREYWVYVPKLYKQGTPVPLIVNSHGQGDIIRDYIPRSRFREVADTANFLVAYPQALTVTDPNDYFYNATCWNAFWSAGRADDAGFISDLITKVQADYTIDAQRVYATGHSNGGFMTFLLAAQLSTRLAAIAPISGGIGDGRIMDNNPVRPVPVFAIHGQLDNVVSYSADLMKQWATINGCAPTPALDKLTYTSPNNNYTTEVNRSVWSTSAGTHPVISEEVIGAYHNLSDFGNFGDNMAGEIWRFLRKFRLPSSPGLTSSTNLALNKPVSSSALENSWLASSAAVDGNPATRWGSAFADAQWLVVDLGASYTVNRVKLSWAYGIGKDYNIEVSDDAINWTPIKRVTGNSDLVNDLAGFSGTGRYVRMNGKARVNGWGYSLTEFEVYGTPPAAVLPNLALNKAVTVSGVESANLPGSAAVDGNPATRWASAYNDQQWLYVDLGASYNVNRVKLSWEAAYGKDYTIEVSNDALTWTPIKSVTGNSDLAPDYTGLSGTGRYVRMNGKARATIWGYSLFELEVYGTPATSTQKAMATQLTLSDQLAAASELTVFPNPATTTVALSGVAVFPATAELYDAQGTRLSSVPLTQASDMLDVSKLATGFYTLRVSSPQTVQTIRLQKN